MGDPIKLKTNAKESAAFFLSIWARCNVVGFATDITGADTDDAYEYGYGILPMWAHYADRCRGACLEFDGLELVNLVRREFEANADRVYWSHVSYGLPSLSDDAFVLDADDIDHNGVEAVAFQHLDRYHQTLLFTKHEAWRYEREFRIVILNRVAGEQFINIDSALRGIFLGCEFEDTNLVLAHAENLELPVSKQLIGGTMQLMYPLRTPV
jgi:hypothetical protein